MSRVVSWKSKFHQNWRHKILSCGPVDGHANGVHVIVRDTVIDDVVLVGQDGGRQLNTEAINTRRGLHSCTMELKAAQSACQPVCVSENPPAF